MKKYRVEEDYTYITLGIMVSICGVAITIARFFKEKR